MASNDCCPDTTYWCVPGDGPTPGVVVDGITYPPEGAEGDPYASFEEALEFCQPDPWVILCNVDNPDGPSLLVPKFITFNFPNQVLGPEPDYFPNGMQMADIFPNSFTLAVPEPVFYPDPIWPQWGVDFGGTFPIPARQDPWGCFITCSGQMRLPVPGGACVPGYFNLYISMGMGPVQGGSTFDWLVAPFGCVVTFFIGTPVSPWELSFSTNYVTKTFSVPGPDTWLIDEVEPVETVTQANSCIFGSMDVVLSR